MTILTDRMGAAMVRNFLNIAAAVQVSGGHKPEVFGEAKPEAL